jgi:hypothetical protein
MGNPDRPPHDETRTPDSAGATSAVGVPGGSAQTGQLESRPSSRIPEECPEDAVIYELLIPHPSSLTPEEQRRSEKYGLPVTIHLPFGDLGRFFESIRNRRIEDVVREVLSRRLAALPVPGGPPLLMKKADYARHIDFSVRTLDKLISAGLPVHGSGKLLRIVVQQADGWILRHEAGQLEELDLLAMKNGRQSRRGGGSSG